MIKLMYVNGDSFSFGEELGEVDNKSRLLFNEYKRKHCYSGIIADHYQIPNYINNSMPGGSNQRAYRTMVKDISKLLNDYRPEEIFVNISVTNPLRAEFVHGESEREYWDFMVAYPPGKETGFFYTLWKVIADHFNFDHGWYNFNILLILGIQNFLKVNNIPYLITSSMHNHGEIIRERNSVSNEVLQQLDLKRYHVEPSFMTFCQEYKHPTGPRYHPLEQGHASWAEHLISIIDQRNLLVNGDI